MAQAQVDEFSQDFKTVKEYALAKYPIIQPAQTQLKVAHLEMGRVPLVRKDAVLKNNRLLNLLSRYGDRDCVQFLRGIAYNVKF